MLAQTGLVVRFCLALVAVRVCVAVPLTADDSCFSTTSSPYRLYSTHTNYEDVRGHGSDFSLPGCQPSKFYLMSRHGARYPTSSSYESEKHRMPRIHSEVKAALSKSTMCSTDKKAISDWEFRMHSHLAGALSPLGKQQAIEAGRRWAQRFPGVVGKAYSSDRYDFRHTYIKRTEDTARGYAQGMFNKSDFHMPYTSSGHCDSMLLYYSCCEKYRKTVHDVGRTEYSAFEKNRLFLDMVVNVNHRLGLHHDTLSYHDVFAVYDTCAFEHGIFSDSPWCAAFTNEDIHVLEYLRDLRMYYEYGYDHGKPVVYEQTCDLMKDLIGFFRDSTTKVTGKVRVAHDLTMMPFLARLGLYNDATRPTASNYASEKNRTWRSSIIASYMSNVAFVEYKCGSESKIRVFHNEKPIALPMCPASGCLKSAILNSVLGTFADSCNFGRICNYDPSIVG